MKALIADDHPLFRQALHDALARLFADTPEDLICIEATSAPEVHACVRQEDDLDLVLLDLFMPGSKGMAELVDLRALMPSTPIVIVSSMSDERTVAQAITCGAAGFIPKSTAMENVLRALRTVLDGGIHVPRDTASCSDARAAPPTPREPLTLRQIAVLALLARGKSNKEIARELRISDLTVKAHVTSILRKLAVSTRAQAIVAFRRDHSVDADMHGSLAALAGSTGGDAGGDAMP